MTIYFRRLLSCKLLVLACLLGLFSGCKVTGSDYVTYQARGFIIYDGLTAVVDAELIERNVYASDGYLKSSTTRLLLTNRSGYAIDLDLELLSAYWYRRVDIAYFADGEVVDLGIVSYDANAFAASITSAWNDLDYYWFNVGISF